MQGVYLLLLHQLCLQALILLMTSMVYVDGLYLIATIQLAYLLEVFGSG